MISDILYSILQILGSTFSIIFLFRCYLVRVKVNLQSQLYVFTCTLTDWVISPILRITAFKLNIQLTCLIFAYSISFLLATFYWVIQPNQEIATFYSAVKVIEIIALIAVLAFLWILSWIVNLLTIVIIVFAILSFLVHSSPNLSGLYITVSMLLQPFLIPIKKILDNKITSVRGSANIDFSPLLLLFAIQLIAIVNDRVIVEIQKTFLTIA